MNKAAFLDILNHVSSISEQEVIELEKLALNFPYCQSAHLLLAKAAYDRGSMLSNQRLRRAAACAANRQLLKKLIYTSGMNLVLEPLADNGQPQTVQAEALPVLEPIEAEPLEIASFPAVVAETPAPTALPAAEPLLQQPPPVLESIETETFELETQEALAPREETPEPVSHCPQELLAPATAILQDAYELPDLLEEADTAALMQAPATPLQPEPAAEQPEVVPALLPQPEEAEDLDDLFAVVMTGAPKPIAAEADTEDALKQAPSVTEEGMAPQESAAALSEGYDIPDLLEESDIDALMQAPAAQAAPPHFEAEQPAAVPPVPAQTGQAPDQDDLFAVDFLAPLVAYQDPVMSFVNSPAADGPDDTAGTEAHELPVVAAAPETAVTEPVLPEPEKEQPEAAVPAAAPALPVASPEASESDQTLTRFDHYLFTPEKEAEPGSQNEGIYQEEIIYKVFDANELGYWMDSSRLGETLMRKNELATAQPYFFRPELLLEYSRHHEIGSYQSPESSVLSQQLDIIDQFLKLNPKIKSMANLKIKPENQEDLSLKSTKIRKSLASETLANILVQQGKIKKAIKIYEHLILKLPEKKDYFASQIEKLQNIT